MSGWSLINEVKAWFSTNDQQRLRVEVSNDNPINVIGQLVFGTDYDRIDVSYPSATQEVYAYTLAGAAVRTIEVNYQTSQKENLISVVVS